MQTTLKNKRYVSFDKDGSILKIGHNPNENYDWFEIDVEEIADILSGKERLINCTVDYDFIEKRYTIKNKEQLTDSLSVNSFIYEIPQTLDEVADIKIIQDLKKKCWRIEISEQLEKYLQEQSINTKPKKQYYSLTKKGDPNILYRLLQFNEDEIPFEYDFEFDKKDISIYTVRKFSTYIHEVIDE